MKVGWVMGGGGGGGVNGHSFVALVAPGGLGIGAIVGG